MLLVSFAAGAESLPYPIGVIYPDTARPYSRVFAEILEGIERRSGANRITRFVTTEEEDSAALRRWLEKEKPSSLITLGRAALNVYRRSESSIPRVIGALDASPQTHVGPGISLQVDPALLFDTLKRLTPHVQRVLLVYNPRRDRWLYELAERTAVRHDLKMLGREVTDLKASAKAYWKILRTANPDTDAIWLSIDNSIIDDNVLEEIIKQSWYRRLVVCSNNLQHADMGVLFALFPDTRKLGARLAEKALHIRKDSQIEPLRAVKTAVSLRMLNHLGISLDPGVRRQIDIVLPRR